MNEVIDRAVPGRRALRLARQDDEARRVVRLVLHILPQNVEAVDLRREARGERAALRIAELGDIARRARRVGGDLGREAKLADDAAALAERVDVALHHLQVRELRAAHAEELVVHGHEMLADDRKLRGRQQMVDVGNAAGHGILDRDHRRGRPRRNRPPGSNPRRSAAAPARNRERPPGRRCGSSPPARPGTRRASSPNPSPSTCPRQARRAPARDPRACRRRTAPPR